MCLPTRFHSGLLSGFILAISLSLSVCNCISAYAASQIEKTDVIIISGQDIYEYKYENGSIYIDKKSNLLYECVNRPDNVTITHVYDNVSEIGKISIKGRKKVKPEYRMFGKDGIFYSDTKVCYFTIPFLNKGDAANVNINIKYKDIAQFRRIWLSDQLYIRNKTVKIIVPTWLELEVYERNFHEGISTHVARDSVSGNTVYTFSITDQHAVDLKEENAPSILQCNPYIILAPLKTKIKGFEKEYSSIFDGLYAWNAEMAAYTTADTLGIREVQRNITRNCNTENEAIRELYSWVQTNIRYIAFAYELERYIPSGAMDVYEKKYGDCKGMANLLKALLRSRGLDARLAWIWAGHNREEDITIPEFNHMICVLFHDGKTYYLDPTVRYMAVDECYDHIQGKMTMVEDGESYLQLKTPAAEPGTSIDSLYCEYRLEENVMYGKAVVTLSGVWKESLLNHMESSNSSTRISGLTRMLQSGRIIDRIENVAVSGVDNHNSIVRIAYNEQRKSGLESANNNLYLDMDTRKDLINRIIDTEKRKTDYLFTCKGRIVRHETIAVPEGYGVGTLPEGLSIERPNYNINISYYVENNAVTYRKIITVKDVWLKKERFAEFNADILRLRNCYGEQVVFEKL